MKLRVFHITAVGLLLGASAIPPYAIGQVRVMPGSVARGEEVLQNKECLDCHALNGRGGSLAPDFGTLSGRSQTPSVLASAMWNHMPKMWATYDAAQKNIQPITSIEAADLFAYFYAALYFAPPGDVVRGRAVFQEKGCIGCHGDVADRRSGSLNGKWQEAGDPVSWAEQMWNHASEMDSAVSNRGIRWPNLSGSEIVDLLTFVSKSSDGRYGFSDFYMGEPERGREVFERSCESCHSFGGNNKSKVDLLARSHPTSFTDYLADMWNHAPAMKRRNGSTAKLNAGEMGDLIAFLFTQRYFFETGDARRGRDLFVTKRCADCHELLRRETGAPDLSQSAEAYSPITLTSAAWRHGPSMLTIMHEQHIPWPEFQGSEMADLVSYLNSQLVSRIGR